MLKAFKSNKILVIVSTFLAIAILLLSYYNTGSWFVNLLAYSIPFFLGLIFLTLIFSLITKQFKVSIFIIFLISLLAKPLFETFSLGYLFQPTETQNDSVLKVITFNVSTFNKERNEHFVKEDSTLKQELFSFFKNEKNIPDIFCIQEFHHDDAENLNVINEVLNLTGLKYYYTRPVFDPNQNGFSGLMTMSRFPIVKKAIVFKSDSDSLNMGMYTDIKVGKDTIRVVNIHLHSMSIRFNDTSKTSIPDVLFDLVDRLRMGSERSKEQIQPVLNVLKNAPYPVLLCGDFNSFPTGYTYQKVKELLDNSFERAGKGFGYSLNIFPYLGRIDNQFGSKEFVPLESNVIREIKNSDHFPVFAKYVFRAKK
jgi:endonuclease/exonuclease/phosphatase family metal-dependent hydrolase